MVLIREIEKRVNDFLKSNASASAEEQETSRGKTRENLRS
jgi:hypothetical protein